MKAEYHRTITLEALQGRFIPRYLEAVLAANLHQDRLAGQIGHPQFHYDDNAFEAGDAYLQAQRAIVLAVLASDQSPRLACAAFGRLTHAAQDLYAHSNYVALWLAQSADPIRLDPSLIDPIEEGILSSPSLRSGKIYLPWVLLTLIPGLGRAAKALIPRDSHTWMNLDDPTRGHLFPYAVAAAKKRTTLEYQGMLERIKEQIGQEGVSRFTGLETPL